MGGKTSMMLRDDEVKEISEETGFTQSQIEKLHSRFSHLDRGSCGSLGRDELMSIPDLAANPLCDRLIQMFLKNGDPVTERISFRQFLKSLAVFRLTNHNGSGRIQRKNDDRKTPGPETRSLKASSQNTATLTTLASGRRLPEEFVNGETIRSNRTINTLRTSNLEPPRNIVLSLAEESLREKLAFIFKIYDVDSDGKISFNDLRNIIRMMVGNYIEDVQLDKIATRAFVEVDDDSDGYIEFDEFCEVLNGRDLDDKLRVKFLS